MAGWDEETQAAADEVYGWLVGRPDVTIDHERLDRLPRKDAVDVQLAALARRLRELGGQVDMNGNWIAKVECERPIVDD